MRPISVLLFSLCLGALPLQAQEHTPVGTPRFRLGVETGSSILWGSPGDFDRIRESRSYYSYYDDDYYGSTPGGATMEVFHLGLKLEYVLSARFAASVGARFSKNKIRLRSDHDGALFHRNYFLWKVGEEGLNTDYVSINKLFQTNDYAGIPLEIKFYPRKKDYFVRHFFTLGTALNFLVNSSNDVRFEDPRMRKHRSVVKKQMGEPAVFQALGYVGIGLKIGNSRYAFGEVDLHLPVWSLTGTKANALIHSPAGIAIRATFYLPVLTKHRLNP